MDETSIAGFAEARLADDERFLRVMTAVGERRAETATEIDIADMLGLMVGLLSDPEAAAELERWADHDLQPPSHANRLLAGIAMRRRLLEVHKPVSVIPGLTACWHCRRPYPCQDARIVVATWSAHPGWRKAWAP